MSTNDTKTIQPIKQSCCVIIPRKNQLSIDFINICMICYGTGGSIGNVYHNKLCSNYNCIHSNYYFRSINFKYNLSDERRVEDRWTNFQPTKNDRQTHINFNKDLKKKLVESIKQLDTKLWEKVNNIIEYKTQKRLHL